MITVIGFILVAQPTFLFGGILSPHAPHLEGFRWLGIAFALTCSICSAFSFVVVRKLGLNVHFSLSMLHYSFINSFVVICFRLLTGKTFAFCFNHLPVTILAGLLFFVSQILSTMALQRQKAGSVALIRSSEVVFLFLLQYLVMGVVPTILGAIGAGLILFVCVMLALKSICKAMKTKS